MTETNKEKSERVLKTLDEKQKGKTSSKPLLVQICTAEDFKRISSLPNVPCIVTIEEDLEFRKGTTNIYCQISLKNRTQPLVIKGRNEGNALIKRNKTSKFENGKCPTLSDVRITGNGLFTDVNCDLVISSLEFNNLKIYGNNNVAFISNALDKCNNIALNDVKIKSRVYGDKNVAGLIVNAEKANIELNNVEINTNVIAKDEDKDRIARIGLNVDQSKVKSKNLYSSGILAVNSVNVLTNPLLFKESSILEEEDVKTYVRTNK